MRFSEQWALCDLLGHDTKLCVMLSANISVKTTATVLCTKDTGKWCF
jgi:hypothetical protein